MAINRPNLTIQAMLLILVPVLFAAACTGSQPSDELAKETWLRIHGPHLQQEGHELIEFKKTNGVAGEVSGVKVYEYTFEARVRCNKETFVNVGLYPIPCKSGEVVTTNGIFSFRKTENGWQI